MPTQATHALKTPASMPVSMVAPQAMAVAVSTPSLKSRFKRWLGVEEEVQNNESSASDMHSAQAPIDDKLGLVKTDKPSTSPEEPAQAETEVAYLLNGSANGPTIDKSPGGLNMSSLVHNLVGDVPLGAALSNWGLMLYSVTHNSKNSADTGVDKTAPVLQTAATSADGKTIILSYDELLGATSTMPAAGAFSVTSDGASVAITGVARGNDGKSVVLTLAQPITGLKTAQVSYTAPPAPAEGSFDLSLATRDGSGNRAANFSAKMVTVNDTTAPTVLSGNAYTTTEATVLVLNASETLREGGLPPTSAFTVMKDGVLNPVAAVSVVGNQVRLTLQNKLSNVPGQANVFTVAYAAPVADVSPTNVALQDAIGNDLAAIVTPLVINNHAFDASPPKLSTATINALGNEINLTWSEALDAASAAPASAFTVQTAEGGTIRSVAVSAVRVSGSSVVLVLADAVASSSAGIQVGYSALGKSVLQDLAGNDVAGFAAQGVVNAIDTLSPTVVSGSFKDSKTLVLTHTEDLLSTSTATANAFSVTSDGKANGVTAVKVVGKTIELSLSQAVVSGEDIRWSYAAPTFDRSLNNAAVQDLAGNDMVSASAQKVDTTRPTLLSTQTGSTGSLLVMNFNEPMLSTSLPANATFQVIASQSGVHTVSSVSVSGNSVNLSLSSPVLKGESVSLTYTAPSDNIGTNNSALQDQFGNDVFSLGTPQPLAVSNQVTAALLSKSLAMNANSQLNQVVLKFDGSLTGSPAASAFTVAANGIGQSVSRVSVNGSEVTLDLLAPLSNGTSAVPVTVAYAAPSNNALLDSSGLVLGSFSAAPVATIRTGTSGLDNLNGTAAASDYFVVSPGADVLAGAGGVDVFAWPQSTSNNPVQPTTIKDFGLQRATGGLQGSTEADILDLSHLLTGYASTTRSQYLQLSQDSNGKLVMNIDRDGGSTFEATESVLFDNITVNSGGNLVVNNAATSYSMGNLLDQLIADAQLQVS